MGQVPDFEPGVRRPLPATDQGFTIKRIFYTLDGKRANLTRVRQSDVLVATQAIGQAVSLSGASNEAAAGALLEAPLGLAELVGVHRVHSVLAERQI